LLLALGGLAVIASVLLAKSGVYGSFKLLFIVGLIALGISLTSLVIISTNQNWEVMGKEMACVRQTDKREGFIFRYISMKERRIPVVGEDHPGYDELFEEWGVTLDENIVKSAKSGDTTYCYTFEQTVFGRPTGKSKTVIHATPIPSYEFVLFSKQERMVDTAVKVQPAPAMVDTSKVIVDSLNAQTAK